MHLRRPGQSKDRNAHLTAGMYSAQQAVAILILVVFRVLLSKHVGNLISDNA